MPANLSTRFPNASAAFLKLNEQPSSRTVFHADNPAKATIVERDSGDGALGEKKAKGRDTGRFLVCVTSFRRILLDEDNLCEKFHVDCCRYAGILPDDAPSKTRIETRQEKVRSKAEERIEISVTKIVEEKTCIASDALNDGGVR